MFLCTLSMLSNPTLHIFTSVNPIKTLVVDEASQITLGSYVVPLTSFPTISKMCMIGDDKQCRLSLAFSLHSVLIFLQCLPMAQKTLRRI